jgi:L-threonylcarbamoyladenylate synthase
VQTRLIDTTETGLLAAAEVLHAGGLVAMPTETVYGLAASARDDTAVARIFAAKGRPHFNPLIVHLANRDAAEALAVFHAHARALADAFWPGPLTLVLPLKPGNGLSPLVTAGLGTVALRLPAHPVAQSILDAFDGPIAAPSANPSGKISPTTAAHVMHSLSGRIEAVVDGGPCEVGVESTIVGFAGETPVLLRAGGVSCEDLERVLGQPITLRKAEDGISAPGQLQSHYAPSARVRLNVSTPEQGELWVGFGPETAGADLTLSASGDLLEAAAALFQTLHLADATGAISIAFAPIPEIGLGRAINDRLRRAAAPRP